jgi:hypothetical protein
MDSVTQDTVGTALQAGETVILATTHTLSNVEPGVSKLSSGQVWSDEDAQTSQHPYLVHLNAGNVMVTDHEDQPTLQTLAPDCLLDGHCATEGLEHAEFSDIVQHIVQQDFDDQLVTLGIRDIIGKDYYDDLSDIKMDPMFWSM